VNKNPPTRLFGNAPVEVGLEFSQDVAELKGTRNLPGSRIGEVKTPYASPASIETSLDDRVQAIDRSRAEGLPCGRKPLDKLIKDLRVIRADPDPDAVADSG